MNFAVFLNMLENAAQKIGATIEMEPEYKVAGMVTFQSGKRSFFRGTSFNINGVGSMHTAKDKGYASYFLQKLGYAVPQGQTFFSEKLNEQLTIKRNIDDGYEYAETIGFPVIVKPNDRSQGLMVAKVHSKTEYYAAANLILEKNNVLLVQEFCTGRDYRVVVLGDEVIAAYERTSLKITGDGIHNIQELVENKLAKIQEAGRLVRVNLEDFRITQNLQRLNLTLESILPLDEKINLLDNANLSTGGDSFDFTATIDPSFVELAINITKDISLGLCGVDIMTADITRPMSEQDYHIIEINASPGLDNFASIGETQKEIVQNFYVKLLLKIEQKSS